MKLRNKKTGQIVELDHFSMHYSYHYDYGENARGEQPCTTWNASLAELNEEWEDMPEEPKEHWAIDQFGEPINVSGLSRLQLEKLHRLGNDFPSENATMKAIEKLKAWKRLKDKGIKFKKETFYGGHEYSITACYDDDYAEDLDLLFGGEE